MSTQNRKYSAATGSSKNKRSYRPKSHNYNANPNDNHTFSENDQDTNTTEGNNDNTIKYTRGQSRNSTNTKQNTNVDSTYGNSNNSFIDRNQNKNGQQRGNHNNANNTSKQYRNQQPYTTNSHYQKRAGGRGAHAHSPQQPRRSMTGDTSNVSLASGSTSASASTSSSSPSNSRTRNSRAHRHSGDEISSPVLEGQSSNRQRSAEGPPGFDSSDIRFAGKAVLESHSSFERERENRSSRNSAQNNWRHRHNTGGTNPNSKRLTSKDLPARNSNNNSSRENFDVNDEENNAEYEYDDDETAFPNENNHKWRPGDRFHGRESNAEVNNSSSDNIKAGNEDPKDDLLSEELYAATTKAYDVIATCMRDLVDIGQPDIDSAEELYTNLARQKEQPQSIASPPKEQTEKESKAPGDEKSHQGLKYSVKDLVILGSIPILQEVCENSAIPEDVRFKVQLRDNSNTNAGENRRTNTKDQRNRFSQARTRGRGSSESGIVDESPALPPTNPSFRKGSFSSTDSIGRRLSTDSLQKLKREIHSVSWRTNTSNMSESGEELVKDVSSLNTIKPNEENKTQPVVADKNVLHATGGKATTNENTELINPKEGQEKAPTPTATDGKKNNETARTSTNDNTQMHTEKSNATVESQEVGKKKEETETPLLSTNKDQKSDANDAQKTKEEGVDETNPIQLKQQSLMRSAFVEIPFAEEEINNPGSDEPQLPSPAALLDDIHPRNITPPLRHNDGEEPEDDERDVLWGNENIESIQTRGDFQFAPLDKAKEQHYLEMHGKLPSYVCTLPMEQHEPRTLQQQSKIQDISASDITKPTQKLPFSSLRDTQYFYETDQLSESKNVPTEPFGRSDVTKENVQQYRDQVPTGGKNKVPGDGMAAIDQQDRGFNGNQPQGVNILHGDFLEEDLLNGRELTEEERREQAWRAYNQQRLQQYRRYAQQYGILPPTPEQQLHYSQYGEQWEKMYYKRQIFKKHQEFQQQHQQHQQQQQQQQVHRQGGSSTDGRVSLQNLIRYKNYYYNQRSELAKKLDQNPQLIHDYHNCEQKLKYVLKKIKEMEVRNAQSTNPGLYQGSPNMDPSLTISSGTQQTLVPGQAPEGYGMHEMNDNVSASRTRQPTKSGEERSYPLPLIHDETHTAPNPNDQSKDMYMSRYYQMQSQYRTHVGMNYEGTTKGVTGMTQIPTSDGVMDAYYEAPLETAPQMLQTQAMSHGSNQYGHVPSKYVPTMRTEQMGGRMTRYSDMTTVGLGTGCDDMIKEQKGTGSEHPFVQEENTADNVMDLNLATFGYRTAEGLLAASEDLFPERPMIGGSTGEIHDTTINSKEEREHESEKSNRREGAQGPAENIEIKISQSKGNISGISTAGVTNKAVMEHNNDDFTKEKQSAQQPPKYDPASRKESGGVPSAGRMDKAPLWFYQGFKLYKAKYNPDANELDVYWAKYVEIKNQQWNLQLLYKKRQSGDATVRNLPPPPIQLTSQEKAFFKCVEHFRKIAKTQNTEQGTLQQQQQHILSYSQTSRHGRPLHQSQQGAVSPLSGSINQNNISGVGMAGIVDYNTETPVNTEEKTRMHGPTHSPLYHSADPHGTVSATMPMHRMMQGLRGNMPDYVRSPPMSTSSVTGGAPNAMGATSGVKMYYNSQMPLPMQYPRQYAQSHVGSMSPPLADASGHRSQYSNATMPQKQGGPY